MTIERWILAVDERGGRLVRVDRTEAGTIHASVTDEVREQWEDHEHGRPSPRNGRNGHTNASRGHERETRRARFAKEVAGWLEKRAQRLDPDNGIAVFAPPAFLGALRSAWSPRLARRVGEHACELARIPVPDLARHPSVVKLMAGPRGART